MPVKLLNAHAWFYFQAIFGVEDRTDNLPLQVEGDGAEGPQQQQPGEAEHTAPSAGAAEQPPRGEGATSPSQHNQVQALI